MPLLFDMPFSELQSYQGRNPRPKDFDQYWDAAILEMRQTDPRISLEKADFSTNFAECLHLYFTGVRGARVHARLLRPTNYSGKRPALLVFHGYSGASPSWIELLPYAAQGFVVAALDCRGQGGLSEDVGGHKGPTQWGHIIRGLEGPAENMLYRHIFLDTAQLARIIMDFPDVDSERVGAMGGSQGGGLTLACAALEPRIRLAASTYPFLCDYQRVWEIDLAKDAYHELHDYFRRRDPLHARESEIFTRLGYIDVQHLAPRIRAEVLMGVALMDTVCPPSTQFAAYNKISAPKSTVIYPDFAHEILPGLDERIFQFMSLLCAD